MTNRRTWKRNKPDNVPERQWRMNTCNSLRDQLIHSSSSCCQEIPVEPPPPFFQRGSPRIYGQMKVWRVCVHHTRYFWTGGVLSETICSGSALRELHYNFKSGREPIRRPPVHSLTWGRGFTPQLRQRRGLGRPDSSCSDLDDLSAGRSGLMQRFPFKSACREDGGEAWWEKIPALVGFFRWRRTRPSETTHEQVEDKCPSISSVPVLCLLFDVYMNR